MKQWSRSIAAPVRELPRPLLRYWLAICGLAALASGSTYAFRRLLHRTEFPYGVTLLPASFNDGDFLCFASRFAAFHTANFYSIKAQPFNYPAPVALCYEVFFGLAVDPARRFAEVVGTCFLGAAAIFAWALWKKGINPWVAAAFSATALVLSYPFQLEYQLLNMEFAVWLVLTLGIWLYVTGLHRWAALFFGLAAAFKIYPIFFVGLALAQKRWKDAVVTAAVPLLVILASMRIVGPTVLLAYRGLTSQMGAFSRQYVDLYHVLEGGIDHSLFEFVKLAFVQTHHAERIHRAVLPYMLSMACVGIWLYCARLRRLPLLNQVLALSIAAILFPPVSHDYTLINLYASWAMLVFYILRRGREPIPKAAVWMLACFALLFTSQNYIVYAGARYAGQFKAIILLVLLWVAASSPLKDAIWDLEREARA